MLDIHVFRNEPDLIRDSLAARGDDPSVVDTIREADARRREILNDVEALRAERNRESKEIGRTKDAAERDTKIAAMRDVNTKIDALESELQTVESTLTGLMEGVPNVHRADVPVGADESENVLLRSWGETRKFDFEPQAHWDIGPALGIIDFERGVRLSGSRFYVLRGDGARLQRALIQWMLDFHTSRGYVEVYPPAVVREQCMLNASQLPKFRDNLYHDVEDDLWLVPTAEVPLTNMHAGEILSDEQLPIDYVAYTPCFRREKMSAGRDVRGIKRGHQFDKVEMYKFTKPEDSADALDAMMADGEALLQAMELPYRVLQICTGDLSFGSMVSYDLEVWAPGCDEWLEVSSISDFGSFQARRAGIRFRPEKGAATQYVHTLNGSGLALPRTMIAILENHQREDGSVEVPAFLRDRMGTDLIGPAST